MKARFAATLYCADCNRAMEHRSGGTVPPHVTCINENCANFGLLFEPPTIELSPIQEPTPPPP